MRDCAVGHQDVHRHAGRDRPDRRDADAAGRVPHAGEREAMPLIVRRRAVLAAQVVRIDRPVRERNLIVVRVVERLRQRVGRAEPERARRAARR